MLHLQWSTLVFQLLNFFVLLFVLGRFLYRPLMDALERREQAVAARVREADARAKAADAERAQLAEAGRAARAEGEALLARARAEAAKLKEAQLTNARKEAARLMDEARQRIADDERAAQQRLSAAARAAAIRIAGSLVGAVAGRPFHEALVAQLLDGGLGLDRGRVDLLRRALNHAGGEVLVETAYPISDDVMSRLEEVLVKALGADAGPLRMRSRVDAALGAGVRLVVGVGVVDLSLRHTLDDLERGGEASGS
jgi:F-type H+-transporting ATPase subunit b